MPLGLVQRLIDPEHQPAEHPLIRSFGQSLDGKLRLLLGLSLLDIVSTNLQKPKQNRMNPAVPNSHEITFLCVWNQMSALKRLKAYVNDIFVIFVHCDLDSGRQDGPCEVGHVDAQEVTHFLRSCGDKKGGGVGNSMQTKREREKLGANGCWSTCVVGHGRLVRVALLLEGHVPQLKHGRHHLQETCRTEGLSLSSSSPHLRVLRWLPIASKPSHWYQFSLLLGCS